MGRKQKQRSNKKKKKAKEKPLPPNVKGNFVSEAGPGCYIARRDRSPDWLIEWEDVDAAEFEEQEEEVPDVAIDTDERTLSLCNLDAHTKVAYVSVYDTVVMGANGTPLKQGHTIDNQGNENECITFIVLVPPLVFVHLCLLDVLPTEDITKVRIESDVQEWNQHPIPTDEHPLRLGFPLANGPFLCTQGENGELTHFFSGNLHAIDFRCPVGTPLLSVGDGVVVETKDENTLTGIAVTNLFEWNSVLIQMDEDQKGVDEDVNEVSTMGGNLFVEYVHIQKSTVRVGDRVKRGDVIGSSGSVGFSPEPHLHFSAFRSQQPDAPTVRVRFEGISNTAAGEGKVVYLPQAGKWYNETGPVGAPLTEK